MEDIFQYSVIKKYNQNSKVQRVIEYTPCVFVTYSAVPL